MPGIPGSKVMILATGETAKIKTVCSKTKTVTVRFENKSEQKTFGVAEVCKTY